MGIRVSVKLVVGFFVDEANGHAHQAAFQCGNGKERPDCGSARGHCGLVRSLFRLRGDRARSGSGEGGSDQCVPQSIQPLRFRRAGRTAARPGRRACRPLARTELFRMASTASHPPVVMVWHALGFERAKGLPGQIGHMLLARMRSKARWKRPDAPLTGRLRIISWRWRGAIAAAASQTSRFVTRSRSSRTGLAAALQWNECFFASPAPGSDGICCRKSRSPVGRKHQTTHCFLAFSEYIAPQRVQELPGPLAGLPFWASGSVRNSEIAPTALSDRTRSRQ